MDITFSVEKEMSSEFVVSAEPRKDQGKGASRRLRRTGKVPAILYGAGKGPVPLTLDHNELLKQLEKEAFYSHILTIDMGGKKEQAILKDMQRHPAKPFILHMDFMRVSAGEKIRVNVPLHFRGAEMAPGVKIGGGIATHAVTEVEINCLPKDLPEYIDVDLSELELGQSLHLSDITLPKGVELVQLLQGEEHDVAIAAIQATRGAAEAEETEAAAGEEGEAESGEE